MATLLILGLLIIAALLFITNRKKSGLAFLIISILCYIGIGNGLIPAVLLKNLQISFLLISQPQWKKNNAIVLLGAGAVKLPDINVVNPMIMAYSRINTAARSYLECQKSHNKCTIMISGGDALQVGTPEAVVYQKMLIELGVNNSDIILEQKSLNTYQNAELTSALLKQQQFDQIVLITSGIHLRRALLYFSHFGIHAKPVMADYLISHIGVVPLGYNFAMTDFAIHEYLGTAQFYIYNFLGWNKPV